MTDKHKTNTKTALKGRVHGIVSDVVKGWVYNISKPNDILVVKMRINGKAIETKKANLYRHDLLVNKIGNGDHAFEFNIPVNFRNGLEHIINISVICIEDGEPAERTIGNVEYRSEIIDAIKPVLIKDKNNTSSRYMIYANAYDTMSYRNSKISVIIPVFNALEKTIECLLSLKKNTPSDVEIIVINDCSTDPNVKITLKEMSDSMGLSLINNDNNIGFTGSVNKGMQISGRNDVVLLNSDTRVVKNWLSNLALAAHSGHKVATATPISDNAGPFTALNSDKLKEIGWNDENIAQIVREASDFNWMEVPTAHGFCMYIRRDCIDDIGLFDITAFPKGYGEENDFSMRAIRQGWKHVLDDRTIVFHAEAASFGGSKSDYLISGRSVIDRRYPEYKSLVNNFIQSETLKEIKNNIKNALSYKYATGNVFKQKILFVINKLTGGTPQTTLDLASQIQNTYDCYALRSEGRLIYLCIIKNGRYINIEVFDIGEPLCISSHRSSSYDGIVSALLIKYQPDIVHIRQLGLHGLGLIEICKTLRIPMVYSFHDFYSVCPNIKLIDNNHNYCAGKCTDSDGDCSVELWPNNNVPPLKNDWVFHWRQKFDRILTNCDAFITTSPYAAEVIKNNLNTVKEKGIRVIPHGRDFKHFYRPESRPLTNIIKILIPGNISGPKGALIIKKLKEIDVNNNIEIHIVGRISKELHSSNIFYHGTYMRDEAVEKFRSIGAHIGAIFSIWPETYCHTLTEMWASGLPVLGFDIGAVGERIKSSRAGWAIPIMPAEDLLENILELIDTRRIEVAADAVYQWQGSEGASYGLGSMARQYEKIYHDITGGADR